MQLAYIVYRIQTQWNQKITLVKHSKENILFVRHNIIYTALNFKRKVHHKQGRQANHCNQWRWMFYYSKAFDAPDAPDLTAVVTPDLTAPRTYLFLAAPVTPSSIALLIV